MKREWILTIGVVAASVAIALGLIRWLAPSLLGIPADLELVQLSKKLPPFYDAVFRSKDLSSNKFILHDPVTRVRARPFFPALPGLGPNDLLGFRNGSVPTVADVIAIGDSQTYGNNVGMHENWPHQMARLLASKHAVVYSMATGGWAAEQYLYSYTNATVFRPRVVVIAFYTGNDALESYDLAYGSPLWARLRTTPGLGPDAAPHVDFPAPPDQQWPVKFSDGIFTIFTPQLRDASNEQQPAVDAGYAAMLAAAKDIVSLHTAERTQIVFTIIPTKEYVYALKVRRDHLDAPPAYTKLITDEQRRIAWLSKALSALPGARYVDVADPLQQAALGKVALYTGGDDGHPAEPGYAVIARTLAPVVDSFLPPPTPAGPVAVRFGPGTYELGLIRGQTLWVFKDITGAKDGPPKGFRTVSPRDVAKLDQQYLEIQHGPAAASR